MQRRRFSTRLPPLCESSSTAAHRSEDENRQRLRRRSSTPAACNLCPPAEGQYMTSTVPVTLARLYAVPSDVEQQERSFHECFAMEVSKLLEEFSKKFPFQHTIQWSMRVGDRCQHDLTIQVKPPNPGQTH